MVSQEWLGIVIREVIRHVAAAGEYVLVVSSAIDRTAHFQSSVGRGCTPVPRAERGTECVRASSRGGDQPCTGQQLRFLLEVLILYVVVGALPRRMLEGLSMQVVDDVGWEAARRLGPVKANGSGFANASVHSNVDAQVESL